MRKYALYLTINIFPLNFPYSNCTFYLLKFFFLGKKLDFVLHCAWITIYPRTQKHSIISITIIIIIIIKCLLNHNIYFSSSFRYYSLQNILCRLFRFPFSIKVIVFHITCFGFYFDFFSLFFAPTPSWIPSLFLFCCQFCLYTTLVQYGFDLIASPDLCNWYQRVNYLCYILYVRSKLKHKNRNSNKTW